MTERIVVEHVEVLDVRSPAPFEARAGAPEAVFYASSAEVGLIHQQRPREWIRQIMAWHATSRHAFVSMACTGWCAAVLEFARCPQRSAHVYLLEMPPDYTQAVLDAATLARERGELQTQEGAARVVLVKKRTSELRAHDVIVADCAILAKPAGTHGTYTLLLKMRDWINASLPGSSDWVSFWIASTWAERLARGFRELVQPGCRQLHTELASAESDARHWLTIKPVLEFLHHRDCIERRPLLLVTLGGGGRVGMMLLARAEHCAPTPAARVHAEPYPAPAEPPPETLAPRYSEPGFRFADNRYFLTDLPRACCSDEVSLTQGPALV